MVLKFFLKKISWNALEKTTYRTQENPLKNIPTFSVTYLFSEHETVRHESGKNDFSKKVYRRPGVQPKVRCRMYMYHIPPTQKSHTSMSDVCYNLAYLWKIVQYDDEKE